MFALGNTSETNLVGVTPKLICCVRYAIKRTTVDFSVFEGLRSLDRQRRLVAAGASRTMDSYHLTGEAVDLVPYVDKRLQWQMPLCIEVARVMLWASRDLSVPLVWGGVWDRELASLDVDRLEEEIDAYVARWRAANAQAWQEGKRPLIDGPHFQKVRERK